MPRFFLHLRNGSGFAEDEEGMDLPGFDAARAEAVQGIRSLLAEEVRGGAFDLRGSVEIVDEAETSLAIVSFRDAVELRLDEPA